VDSSGLQIIVAFSGGIITIGTAFLTVKKVLRNIAVDKKRQANEILREAKEEMDRREIVLKNKITELETKIEELEKSVDKDLGHLKETFNGEIRNLAAKIEGLRDDLKEQHTQLLQILSKLITG
jgi:peptidoglycan hydrolase CwlO-like protein